jgi:hypothetical protein
MDQQRLSTLQEKLERIGRLETEHRIIGISFAVKEGATVSTEEAADYVISAIEAGVSNLKRIAEIPIARLGATRTSDADKPSHFHI